MRLPTYDYLRNLDRNENPRIIFASGPMGWGGNPRHYKYFWQVFSLESPLEGPDFLQHAPPLCNAQFEAEVARLVGRGMSCMVYGWRRPRRDPANPWDLSKARWHGVEFAPSWDDDTDPIVDGGHK